MLSGKRSIAGQLSTSCRSLKYPQHLGPEYQNPDAVCFSAPDAEGAKEAPRASSGLGLGPESQSDWLRAWPQPASLGRQTLVAAKACCLEAQHSGSAALCMLRVLTWPQMIPFNSKEIMYVNVDVLKVG